MSQEIDPQHELRKAFQQAWDKLVLDTDIEPNLSLIAAYVDGRLNDAETRHLANHLIECPAAWEIMEQMLPEGMTFPTVPDQEVSPSQNEAPESIPFRPTAELEQRRKRHGPPGSWPWPPGGASHALWRTDLAIAERGDRHAQDRLALAVEAQAKVEQLERQQRVRSSQLAHLELTELATTLHRFARCISSAMRTSAWFAWRCARIAWRESAEEPSKLAAANIVQTLDRVRVALQESKSALHGGPRQFLPFGRGGQPDHGGRFVASRRDFDQVRGNAGFPAACRT